MAYSKFSDEPGVGARDGLGFSIYIWSLIDLELGYYFLKWTYT